MKSFYYMTAVQVIFDKDGKLQQRNMNSVIKTVTKNITYKDLDQVRIAVFNRLHDEYPDFKIEPKDMIILAINYLGNMSDEQFNGKPTPEELPMKAAKNVFDQ